jgi:hypothetical protein
MFGTLFFWSFVGIAAAFIIIAASTLSNGSKFDFKKHAIISATYIVIGAVATYFLAQANFGAWVGKIVVCAAGFLLTFVTPKLFGVQKQSGSVQSFLFIPFLKYQVFGGALWILPLLTLLGAIWFMYIAIRAHKSNSTQQVYDPKTDRYITKDNTGNVPYTKIGQFYFSVALFIATIWIVIAMVLDK